MTIQKTLAALAVSTTLLAAPLSANAAGEIKDVELSANVGFVTEYSFRGIQQSDENPALQGGFDVTHSSGLYAGVWGSNVDFNDGDEASVEIDYYAGYSSDFKGLNYDIGALYYTYPGADSDLNYDYMEVSLALGYDFKVFSLSTSVNYSPENFGDSGDATYLAGAVDVPLPHDFSLNAHIGHQWIDDEVAFGVDSYTDWSAGIAYSNWGFDFGLTYIDTNIPHEECEDGCDERVIGSISRSF